MDGDRFGLTAVSSLEDPVRARLYQIVSASAEPTGRDEAAAAAGIGRPLAAYHLDRLVELGLLDASYQRPHGRTGPGAGRPAKLYSRSAREFAVTVPAREYELAARLLAVAVESDTAGRSRTALRHAARQHGANLASQSRPGVSAGQAVQAALAGHGFEPWRDEGGTIRLRNCPFHQLAVLHTDLVCGMNLALIDGLIDGLGASAIHAYLDPGPGRCCVAITAEDPAAGTTTAQRTEGETTEGETTEGETTTGWS
jgi:predicted ArsR family transcriptional regulator